MSRKNNIFSEKNYSPVPAHLVGRVSSSGMRICTFYDNVPNERPLDEKGVVINPYYCITHMIDGDGGCYYNEETGKSQDLKHGDAVVTIAGAQQTYGGYRIGSYIEDAICFEGPTADVLFAEGVIKAGVINMGKTRRLLPIIDKLRDVTIGAHFEAVFMLQQLLIDIDKMSGPRTPDSEEVIKTLIRELSSNINRWWTVSDMAQFCNISDNYLRRLFRSHTGMSPKEYIDVMKMNVASELLLEESNNVNQISRILGYTDPFHFTRRFTKIKGVSPTKFRKLKLE